METAIIVLISVFALGVIFYVEKKMYKYPPLRKDIVSFQKTLDNVREKYYPDKERHDAKTELLKMRRRSKANVYIFSGLIITVVFVVCIFTPLQMTHTLISVFCVSAISLIVYGVLLMNELKVWGIVILLAVFAFGVIFNLLVESLVRISAHSFVVLALIITTLGIFSLRGERKLKLK